MKIDRVIFCLNNNPVYTGLWNPISRAWKLKWGITPTLMFVGTEDELKSHDLSKEYGEIVRLNPVPEVVVNPSLDWSATWALFYGASLFPNEVVTLMGLDQLLLSHGDILLRCHFSLHYYYLYQRFLLFCKTFFSLLVVSKYYQ